MDQLLKLKHLLVAWRIFLELISLMGMVFNSNINSFLAEAQYGLEIYFITK